MRTILCPEWLIDGTGAAPLSQQAVILVDNKIESIVPANTLEMSTDDETYHIIKLPNMTLLPGLINHHVHLVLPGDNTPFFTMNAESDATLALRAAHNIQKSLRAGVTTVRDCGGRSTIIIDTREAQKKDLIQGTRIVSCGWTLTITGGHTRNFGGECDGVEGVHTMVRRVISQGAEYVKVMASGGGTPGSLPSHPSFTVEELRAIVELSHSMGKTVTAHCTCTAAIANAVEAGVDFIEHAMFTAPDTPQAYDPRVAERLAQSGIRVTPTLQVFRDLVDLLPPGAERANWKGRNEAHEWQVNQLIELGVPLLAGSDAGWRATDFNTFWKELDELVICGLTPVQAIHAATGAVSQAFGHDQQYGTIRAGLLADLLVVEGDASQNIRCLQSVRTVWQGGQLAETAPA
jgi:imidazolonepropionase-like amidohydrolase